MKALRTNRNRGFTIVELMIATSVLSVILLLATAVMLNIGDIYYKGDNQARVEDSTRAALDSVTQDIQFSENQPVFNSKPLSAFSGGYTQTAYAFCMKSANYEFRYTFVTGLKIGGAGFSSDPTKSQINHVFWRDVIDWTSSCTPANLAAPNPETPPSTPMPDFNATGRQGTELLPPDSRLLSFCISPVAGWPGCPAGSPTGGNYTVSVGMAYGDLDMSPNGTCKGGNGDQFCATDSLTSSITPRL